MGERVVVGSCEYITVSIKMFARFGTSFLLHNIYLRGFKIKVGKRAVVLFSGGLDSTTVLYYALSKGYKCTCLMFNYGQKHDKEILSAVKIVKSVKTEYSIIKIILPWSGDSLTSKNKEILIHKYLPTTVPSTYAPGRNTIFLSYALSCAQSAVNARSIFIGVNSVDFSNYLTARQNL